MRTPHARSSGRVAKDRDSFSEKRQQEVALATYNRAKDRELLAGEEIDDWREAEAEVRLLFAPRLGDEP
jgi:hypothetical protein